MEFQFLKKLFSYTTSFVSNELLYELKALVYDTEDKKLIHEKEQALKFLFAGMDRAQEAKWQAAKNFIQDAIDIFHSHCDSLREGFCHFFMGEVFFSQEEKKELLEQALNYYQTAHQMLSKNKNKMANGIEKKIQETQDKLDRI